MPRFLRQVLVQDETLTVSTVRTDDLPVNPLSAIIYTMRMLNDTGTLTDYQLISSILAQISKIEVLYQGSAVISGSLADLARLSGILLKRPPMQLRTSHVNNDVRAITVVIPLGRKTHWPEECFPAVRRGELQLQTTVAAAQTGIDTPVLQVETIELLDAKPSRFLKATTISKTPSATGDHDMDLPIGNKLAGLMLFGTSFSSGASFNASFGQVRLLLDNVEAYYARTNWESLLGDLQIRTNTSPQVDSMTVLENTAALYTQLATSDKQNVSQFYDQYRYMDFDPHTDGQWLVETKGLARVHLRVNADVADAVRVMPVELVDVAA